MKLEEINKIVILTGAGISQESGISTFRDADGLWENHRIEDVASPLGFVKNPDLVLQFYNQRRAQLLAPEIAPNAAHIALAELENKFSGEVVIITQNVDNLHQRAGSKKIIHMHGELLKIRCQACGHIFDTIESIDRSSRCEKCRVKGHLRPHIVWFGEIPLMLDEIDDVLSDVDLFLCIGTSGVVYPAASFVQIAKQQSGCKAIEFNLAETQISRYFDQSIQGPASQTVPAFINELMS